MTDDSESLDRPVLTFLSNSDEVVEIQLDDFSNDRTIVRTIPVRTLELADGTTIRVATAYDVLMAPYGIDRRLGGDTPTSYDDEDRPYTPAWQERYTRAGSPRFRAATNELDVHILVRWQVAINNEA